MEKKNINGSSAFFPQDAKISFEEESHTYTVEGIGEMTPVSSVIGSFFEDFDAEYWSMRKCNNDPIAAARLREEWASKGAVASQAGTHMHKQIEDYITDGKPAEMLCEVNYEGDYVKMHKTIDISTEWTYFQAFDRDTKYTPFRTEWCVFDEDARVAGTIDLICSCDDGSYEIYDWKRSNRIDPYEVNRFNRGKNGLEHLSDTSYVHYCLQQNLYRHILEKNYGIKIKQMNLVVLHPELPSYRIVSIPRMEKEIATIMASRIK